MSYEAGSVIVRGTRHPIYTDDDGSWLYYRDGHAQRAETREKLVKLIERQTRQAAARVSVPFITLEESWKHNGRETIRRGTCTGIHSGTGNELVTWQDGQKEQRTTYGRKQDMRPDTDVAEWERLRHAVRDAKAALEAFETEHKIDVKDEARKALAEAMGQQE